MARTGRPRSFEETDVVARATDLFWDRGYERTSVQDLVEATGLQRGSLYGAFGDKHALFLRALDHYGAQGEGLLEGATPVLPALRAVLLAAAGTPAERARGCLLTNALGELVPADGPVTAAASALLDRLRADVARGLERARAGGETRADLDPAAAAELALVTFLGLRLVGKAGAGRAQMALAVDTLLAGFAEPGDG